MIELSRFIYVHDTWECVCVCVYHDCSSNSALTVYRRDLRVRVEKRYWYNEKERTIPWNPLPTGRTHSHEGRYCVLNLTVKSPQPPPRPSPQSLLSTPRNPVFRKRFSRTEPRRDKEKGPDKGCVVTGVSGWLTSFVTLGLMMDLLRLATCRTHWTRAPFPEQERGPGGRSLVLPRSLLSTS